MNASELSRKLLYCGYSDLTDYLMNSPLNRYIYKMLLVDLPRLQIDVPVLDIFNEIYYQNVRVRFDITPGQDVRKRYLDEEERWLNSKPAAYMVFCYVWAMLSVRSNLSFHEECFVEPMEQIIWNGNYEEMAQKVKSDIVSQGIFVANEVPAKPCPINEIPMRVDAISRNDSFAKRLAIMMLGEEDRLDSELNPWKTLTNNFSRSVIEHYLWLYYTPAEQFDLLRRIENACPKKDYHKHQDSFEDLNDKIKYGRYDRSGYVYDKKDLDEEFELNFVKVYNEAVDAEDKEDAQANALQYKHECELLKRCVEEQKMEIEQLKKELEKKTVFDTPDQQSIQEGNTLPIAEMVAHVKQRFSKAGAEEFCTMYYHLAMEHGNLDEETSKLIDGIVPAILQRDAHHQTINIPTAQQVNINPKEVVNHTKEE